MSYINTVILTSWPRRSPSWAVSQTLFGNTLFGPKKDYTHKPIPLRSHNTGNNLSLCLLATCFILASWSNAPLYLQVPQPNYRESYTLHFDWLREPQHDELEPSWNSSTTADKELTYICGPIADNPDMQGFLVRLSRKSVYLS
jgi:hypothetical protein